MWVGGGASLAFGNLGIAGCTIGMDVFHDRTVLAGIHHPSGKSSHVEHRTFISPIQSGHVINWAEAAMLVKHS